MSAEDSAWREIVGKTFDKDAKFIAHLMNEICDYAVHNGMDLNYAMMEACRTILNALEYQLLDEMWGRWEE